MKGPSTNFFQDLDCAKVVQQTIQNYKIIV